MEAPRFLDMLDRPAFRVQQGTIDYVNPAAAGCLLEAGTPIADLLFTGAAEYEALESGRLYLQLQLGTQLVGACVTRDAEGDLFILDQTQEDPALQALALAAMELRVPLAGVMHAAEQLLPALPEEKAVDAARMHRGLYQLLRRIGNMSDAARYTEDPTGSREIRDICAVLNEIFEKAAAMAEHAGVTVRYQGLSEALLCPVDSEKLERGVYNLLSNAIRFSEAGAVIEAKLQHRGQRLLLTVSDSGSGIPAALRGSLFSRYQRQPGLEDPRHGLGLGMVLIRSAAAAHGGTVLTEFADTGTRITLTFSLAKPTGQLRSPALRIDYAGERDHSLVELSDILPEECYKL